MGLRVYIASPYTVGRSVDNVRRSLEAADSLLEAGHFPYAPLLTHFWDMISPKGYEDWMRLDLEWLAQCHAVVRLPGESKGADREEARAKELGLPVYHSVTEFLDAQYPALEASYSKELHRLMDSYEGKLVFRLPDPV